MFILDNLKVNPDIQRVIGDVQYPAGWFSSAEARVKVGMIEVADPVRPDDNLFTSVENPDGSYTATARTATDLAVRLAAEKATFIRQVDADTDALIRTVIGERGSEYELAEQEATAYKAAGYTGTIPGSVASWATAKGWTATQSADSIIVASTNWHTAQAALRANRLARKEAAILAGDVAGLDVVKAQWATFMAALKTSLGV
jgi:hypothetical protein